MAWPTITKGAWPSGVVPDLTDLTDLDAAPAAFSWAAACARLDLLRDGEVTT